ncbi:MAG: BlaI/MecI/CopY family transcriptional regulator [Candidatus Latescibacteria bacterium]|nr:BlaI/MecI/CopY family transcriptional regulator [Candidatus Latescibacterota bacterium]
MSKRHFGKVQLRIMRVLWVNGRSSAREITDALNRIGTIAHSTVQTLLRKLEQKGAVDHDIDDRTFFFYPLVEEDEVTEYAVHDFVDTIFAGSVGGLVSYLIERGGISSEELEEIRHMLDRKVS